MGHQIKRIQRLNHSTETRLITEREREDMLGVELEPRAAQGYRRGRPVVDDTLYHVIRLIGLNKKIVIWFVMFVATWMAGMITIATLNKRPEIKILTTTATTTPVNNTTLTITDATTTTKITTTTPINLAMLFLFSKNPSNTPRLIDTEGELSTTFDFNGREVDRSCGVAFKNKLFIFGGDKSKRQILQIDNCGLISIGSTPFDHYSGGCGSTNEAIILCFNAVHGSSNDHKKCRQASSPNGPWTQLALSTFAHHWTSIATSPDEFLAVGSADPQNGYNKKTELYNFIASTWKTVEDYPFGSGSGLGDYDMLYIPETSSFLVIGGAYGNNQVATTQIAKLKDDAWYDAGQLNSVHTGGRAQWLHNTLVVASGKRKGVGKLSTESCTIDDESEKFDCVDIAPILDDYYMGVSFVVPSDFCV